MTTKKIAILFIVFIFTLSNCCKKETTKDENSTTEAKIIEQAETTIEVLKPIAYAKRMAAEKVQLVDIRTQEEFNLEHIENADNINILDSTFTEKITKYNKDIPVYVYCTAGGKRSQDAAKILKNKGYNVVNLEGGLVEWTKKGHKSIKKTSD